MQSIIKQLANIDVNSRISELESDIKGLKGKKDLKTVDKAVKELKVLRQLKVLGISPSDAFTRTVIPVIPAQFRGPIVLSNNTVVNPDINVLMRNVGFINETLKDSIADLPEEDKQKAIKSLYDTVEQLQGFETPEINNQIVKNYYATISGYPGPAKHGFFQQHLTRKRVDLSGRSVISPDPTLDLDQVGLPIELGMSLYEPFIMQELISRGYSKAEATKLVDKRDDKAVDALHRAGEKRPILINRAPSIWKGSVTAHYPVFNDKLNMTIPNLIAQYAKGDFDGDTMAVHVPVTAEAVSDAVKMLPSKNIFDEAASGIVSFPDHSAATGIYLMSKDPKMLRQINKFFPSNLRFSGDITKSQLKQALQIMAKEDSPTAARAVNELRKMGDDFMYKIGFSFGLEDIAPVTGVQQSTLSNILSDIRELKGDNNPDKLRAIYKNHANKASKEIDAHFSKTTDNSFGDIVMSGGRGSASQIRDVVVTPIYPNAAKPIAKPIKHSYIQGLTPSEYFIAAEGARLGVLGRAQGTAMPGALGKELLTTLNTLVVNEDEHDDMPSIDLSLDNADDLLDRYVARDVEYNGEVIIPAKTVVTPKIIQLAKRKKLSTLPVFTPLGSSSASGGIPAMAYGNMPGNKLPDVGYNIGAHSGFGLVAPLFTDSMQSFHSGGGLQDRQHGYPRLKQVLELTKSMPNKATVSTVSGTVEDVKVDSLNGHIVKIDGTDFYVSPHNKVMVKTGDNIKQGDVLSDGPVDPRDIAQNKGLLDAQNYMVDELVRATPGKLRRRAAEVIVEGITRHAKITDPGDSDYLPGDIALLSEIQSKNKDLDDKAKYEFLFKGVNFLPQATQSWMSQLNFRYLKNVLNDAIVEGKMSDTHGYEPAAALAFPAEFGEGDEGRY